MTELHDETTAAPPGQYWDIDAITAELRDAREDWRSAHKRHAEYGAVGFPSRHVLGKIMDALCGALFPLRLGPSFVRAHNEEAFVAETLQTALSRLYGQIRLELGYSIGATSPELVDGEAGRIIGHFATKLPALRRLIDTDVEAAYAGDPAARSVDEVLLCYPCVIAIVHHRLAHLLHGLGAPLVARIISELANSRTGIDIHPGASIGESFFIDHGTGLVIGETAVIGKRVRLYQAVTLGARSFPADADGALRRGLARHPIVEDDVVIYAGATILGRVTIGAGSTIGGNVWLTSSVPPGSTISQARAHRDASSELLDLLGDSDVA
ncbi:serine acetyltransferase [Sphingomonas sp. Root710]|uniref:serine O-acetyltransferase EpsC n=1 Tax=Sphingomonas sp. Root710 TaxID=1736594 RepID=UPI0006F5808A|nr:serine O-acetyltransferase EpsC [Sphingomonas sp. Root710]KRB86285.1 serine acetyltransferase [Sphingomonas sp. Root710]